MPARHSDAAADPGVVWGASPARFEVRVLVGDGDEIPDPATGLRGAARLMRVESRARTCQQQHHDFI